MNEIQNVDIKRTPHIIASEIYAIKGQACNVILLSSVEIGKRLVEAKGMLSHGEWGEWLEKSVEYSPRTAQRLMQIYNEFSLEDSKTANMLANLSYSKAIALLGIPTEEREDFIKDNPVDEMTTRELQQAIKEKKELEAKLKTAEKRADEEHTAWENVSNSYKKLEKTNQKHYQNSIELKKELEAIKSKNNEELVNKEAEIENLKIHIAEMEKKLAAAQESGNTEEVESLNLALREANNSFEEANKKIEELEKQLKEKPIDVITAEPQIIEKVPDEVEKELQELREKLSKASNSNEPIVKFSIYFSELVKNFKELLAALEGIKDEQKNEKYKNAVLGLINKMSENL